MLEGKTVLIIGATGLIGSNLARTCINNGAKVIALARNEKKLQDCFSEYIGSSHLDYLAADISEVSLQFDEFIDYIFHAAGTVEHRMIVNMPMQVIAPNITGTISCLEFLRTQEKKYGKKGKMIFFSSATIYGNGEFDRCVSENETEFSDSLSAQRAPYSHSKRMAEIIVNAYVKQYSLDAVNVRLGWIYGNAKYRSKQALFDFIEQALSGKDIVIRNPDTPKRDNLYVQDAISALLLIAEKGVPGETYNISSNGDMGNYAAADEIAEIIVDIVNKSRKEKVKMIYSTPPLKREGGVKMNNAKLKELGWNVSTSLYEGINRLVKEIEF